MSSCALVVRNAAPPVEFAARELAGALSARNLPVERHPHWQEVDPRCALVVAGLVSDPQIAALLAEHLPVDPAELTRPEGIVTATVALAGRQALVLAGTDPTGLMYALLEEADAVRCGTSALLTPGGRRPPAGPGGLQPAGPHPAEPHPNRAHSGRSETCTVGSARVEFPYLRVRAAALSVMSEEGDRPWLFAPDFWDTYLSLLARARFNRLSLILGHHTAYFSPPYPYFVSVPGFEAVRARGVGEAERERYLEMLRYAAGAAAARGIRFFFGIWQQKPWADQQESLVEGLEPKDLTAYCREGVRALLAACPDIAGLELRVNRESGVEGQADPFWAEFFRGVAASGRPVELDVRAKGMTRGILDAALATGLPVTVSTKYWCEHMGLPYHPTLQQSLEFDAPPEELDRKRRYSYADLLYRPRAYALIYRLWSYGSNRVLLWGDAEYASRFARSCTFGGGEGFELMGPLTCRGGMNQPGVWPLVHDGSLDYCRWEHEKYWLYYLLFGRMGYDPATPAEVWRRELRMRFGEAAAAIEAAYAAASWVLPLVTAACMPSASAWGYWPEMQTGGTTPAYAATEPSDPGLFYRIADYVRDAVQGNPPADKYTPPDVRNWLLNLAGAIESALERAEAATARVASRSSDTGEAPEYRATVRDLAMLGRLARFHAARINAALAWSLHRETGESAPLRQAVDAARRALSEWERLAELGDAYHGDLVFGRRSIHAGHWRDRIAPLREDVAALETELAVRIGPGTADAPPEAFFPAPAGAAGSIAALMAGPADRPEVTLRHEPPRWAPGRPLELTLDATAAPILPHDLEGCVLYRVADQTKAWRRLPMERSGPRFTATVPAEEISPAVDLLYYFSVRRAEGHPLLFPGIGSPHPGATMPYFVLSTAIRPCGTR